jgi:hypothetical protein
LSTTKYFEVHVIGFHDGSYVPIARVPLGLHSVSWTKKFPVIFHQYFGRVRNRIVVWVKESEGGPWVVSDCEVDFSGLSDKGFESDAPRHETDIYEDVPLPDGTRCLSRRLETTGEVTYIIQRVNTMNQSKNLASSLEYPPIIRPKRIGHLYGGFMWGEWNGTLVELTHGGDIRLVRYGLP